MPSSPSTLSALLLQEDQATIYNAFLSICTTLGLPVTSWQAGDPTRSLGFLEAQEIESLEQIVVGFIQSGFLDFAALPVNDANGNPLPVSTTWLNILAKQMFNVDVPAATFAETSLTLTNAGGGIYIIAPGDLTVKSSSTGQTYHNTTGGTLTGVGTSGATLSVTVVADLAGSAGSAGATEIDTMVTTLLGVTCSNPSAAVGLDEQYPSVTISQCRDKLGSLSPNGPAAAYSFVAKNSALTGINTVTRSRVYGDSDTGDVSIYVAGPSGAVTSGDVTAVQNAINVWATPLCITPTVRSASNVVIPVTYSIWVYKSVNQNTTQIEAAILTALETLFSNSEIGGNIIPPASTGSLYQSVIESTIGSVFPLQTFRVTVSVPSGDTALGNGDVPVLGTVTPTVTIITDP